MFFIFFIHFFRIEQWKQFPKNTGNFWFQGSECCDLNYQVQIFLPREIFIQIRNLHPLILLTFSKQITKREAPSDLNQKTAKLPFSRTWATSETAYTETSSPDDHFLPENIWKTQEEIDSLYEHLQSMAEV